MSKVPDEVSNNYLRDNYDHCSVPAVHCLREDNVYEVLLDLPKTKLNAYPNGAWHHSKPDVKIASAVPLIYPPPTQVAEHKIVQRTGSD
jgi:hypothetical protein